MPAHATPTAPSSPPPFSHTPPQQPAPPGAIAALDGLRGLLALWVFVGHLVSECGLDRIPGLSAPGSAVDAFMMLSGFLMVHSWGPRLRSWHGPTVLAFYLSRWMRLSPLYFAALAVVVALGLAMRAAYPLLPDGEPPTRLAAVFWGPMWNFTPGSVLAHLSYLGGLTPSWMSASPLADWSLSLEMQFYLVLPWLMTRLRSGWAWTLGVLISMALSWESPHWWGQGDQAGLWSHLSQPSLLTYRLNVFFAGMLLARALTTRRSAGADGRSSPRLAAARLRQGSLLLTWALAVAAVAVVKPITVVLLIVLTVVVARPWPRLDRWLSAPALRRLGDWSYGVYLLHFPVVMIVPAWVQQTVHPSSPAQVLAWSLLPCLVLVFGLSALAYRWIERPGIECGRRWSKRLMTGSLTTQALNTNGS